MLLSLLSSLTNILTSLSLICAHSLAHLGGSCRSTAEEEEGGGDNP